MIFTVLTGAAGVAVTVSVLFPKSLPAFSAKVLLSVLAASARDLSGIVLRLQAVARKIVMIEDKIIFFTAVYLTFRACANQVQKNICARIPKSFK